MEDMKAGMRSFRDGNGSDAMKTPDEIGAILHLHEIGWGSRRIADELGISRNTVKKYLEAKGWIAYRGSGRQALLVSSPMLNFRNSPI